MSPFHLWFLHKICQHKFSALRCMLRGIRRCWSLHGGVHCLLVHCCQNPLQSCWPFVGRYHPQCFYPWRSAPGHRCFHTGGTEESKWRFFFQLNCGDLDTFCELCLLMFLALVASWKQLPRHTEPWNSAFAAASSLGSLVARGGAQWPLHSGGHKDELKSQCKGCCEIFIIDFGKPSMHSTSLVDHFQGLLAPHFVQTSLRAGVWGQKSRQSQGPRRSLWGLPLGVWLRVHKAWANARPGVGSLYCNGEESFNWQWQW